MPSRVLVRSSTRPATEPNLASSPRTLLRPDNAVVCQIPPCQREYSWSKPQWDDLFDDLLDSDEGHLLGTII